MKSRNGGLKNKLGNWIKNQIMNQIKNHPGWCTIIGVGVVATWFLSSWAPWNRSKVNETNLQFAFAMTTEVVIILVTVFIVWAFVEKRQDEYRAPIYRAVFKDAYRIYSELYDLVFRIMHDVCLAGPDTSTHMTPEFPRIEGGYVQPEKPQLMNDFSSKVIREFFEYVDGKELVLNREVLLSKLKEVNTEVHEFLDLHGPFLVSNETGDHGSNLFEMMRDLKGDLKDIIGKLNSLNGAGKGPLKAYPSPHFSIK